MTLDVHFRVLQVGVSNCAGLQLHITKLGRLHDCACVRALLAHVVHAIATVRYCSRRLHLVVAVEHDSIAYAPIDAFVTQQEASYDQDDSITAAYSVHVK